MPNLRERLRAFAHPPPPDRARTPIDHLLTQVGPSALAVKDGSTAYAARPMEGGRQTQPANYNPFGLAGWAFIPKRQFESIDITELDVQAFSAEQLLALLPDMSPEFGKALWNYLRVSGTSISFQALTPTQDEDAAGQAELDDIVNGLNPQYGGFRALIVQLLITAYLQGAASADVAPTDDLRDVEDIYVVNPDSIYFQRDERQILVPFQRQQIWHASGAMPYRLLNEETFFYVPVDPYVDDPYGRAPAAPVLQVVFGLAQVMRDLQRVIHHQGWPRLDISLVWELMQATVPEAVRQNEQALQRWMRDRMAEVTQAYNNIAPEDAFVHFDYVKLSSDAAAAGQRLFDVQAIMQVFRQEMIEALKSLPIFHGGGGDKGETETYGSIEFEIYVQSVQTLREIVAEVMVRALTVAMHLRGHDCLIRHEWESVRATQRLADAQSESVEIQNAVNKRDQGWISQDDASQEVTGSDAVALPPPPSAAPTAPPHAQPQLLPPSPSAADLASGRGAALAYVAAAVKAGANGHR